MYFRQMVDQQINWAALFHPEASQKRLLDQEFSALLAN